MPRRRSVAPLARERNSAYHARVSTGSDTDERMPSGDSSFLLRGVFHVHTNTSNDCRMSVEAVIARCVDEGVDVLAVTDHNEISGAQAVQRQAPFQVIVGEEIRTAEGGEIIGLFLREKIPRGRRALDAVRDIRAQGGLVYLPHPFDPFRTKRWPEDFRTTLLQTADIIEVFNARSLTEGPGRKAAAAAAHFGKATCVGADAHFPREIGPTVAFLSPFSAPETFLASLRRARFQCQRSPRWALPATRIVEWTH